MCFLDLFVEYVWMIESMVVVLMCSSMVKSHMMSMVFSLRVILVNGCRIWKTKLSYTTSKNLNGPRGALGIYNLIYDVWGTHIEA